MPLVTAQTSNKKASTMKCPLCRGEISMIAEICPHCRSNLKECFSERGGNSENLNGIIAPIVQWFFQTLMLFIPSVMVILFLFSGTPDYVLWIDFIICSIIAVAYRDKLPIF
jgi:hypothetical protein